MKKRNTYLLEDINVDGNTYNADVLGEDFRLRVVDVKDWAAAQAFKVSGSNDRAGTKWVNDESTFTSHIGEEHNLHFYIFVNAANEAVAAAIAPLSSFHVAGDIIAKINLSDTSAHDDTLSGDILPLRFIPGLEYKGDHGILFNSESSKIITTYPGLYSSDETLESYTIPVAINTIGSHAFTRYTGAQAIIITETVTTIEDNAFNDFAGNILCTMESAPDGWSEHWMGNNNHITWNFGRDPEEVARIQREREEAERAAKEANDAACIEKFGVNWDTLIDYLARNGELIDKADDHAVHYSTDFISNPSLDETGQNPLESLSEMYELWVQQRHDFNTEEELDATIRQIVQLFTEHPHLEDEIQAEKERIERERQEAERRRQELQNAEVISVLKYREEGKGITIFGCKKGREQLDIPAEINGKPVTKIAPFAFYGNDTLTDVQLPNTIKEIGKGAFAGTRATIKYHKNATVYSDAFLDNTGRLIKLS